MLNHRQLSFSQSFSEKRLALAEKVLGSDFVKRITGYVLYLLGASRTSVAEFIGMPYDTFKSFTDRVEQSGIPAFFDRREKNSVLSPEPEKKTKPGVSVSESHCIIELGPGSGQIHIPLGNIIQLKVVLLSLLRDKIIPLEDVSRILDYSKTHTSKLTKRLFNEDVNILLDHRQGQKTDYVFTPEIKSEIILQAAGNAVVGKSTSSSVLAEDLKNRKNVCLSDRSIRLHISRLGLKEIKETLPALINTLKKTL